MAKFNQKGEVELFILPLLAFMVFGWVVFQWHQSNEYRRVFQAWTGECYSMGGDIRVSGANLVDCFVDGEPCQVVGYEKYQELNPNPKFNNLEKCGEKEK